MTQPHEHLHDHDHGHTHGHYHYHEHHHELVIPPDAPLIELRGVSYAYPSRPLVLDEMDFTLKQDQRLGIVGPNGAGKSTLFLVAMGLLTPRSGEVWALGKQRKEEKEYREVRANIGLCFQDPDDQLFSPTVLQDVAFGPLNLGLSKDHAIDRAKGVLANLGLEGFEDRITYQLSGGEKRLVSLACVMAMQPVALLLDEPTSGLDQATELRLKQVLGKSDLAFAIISHDREFLEQTCQSIVLLQDGRLESK